MYNSHRNPDDRNAIQLGMDSLDDIAPEVAIYASEDILVAIGSFIRSSNALIGKKQDNSEEYKDNKSRLGSEHAALLAAIRVEIHGVSAKTLKQTMRTQIGRIKFWKEEK